MQLKPLKTGGTWQLATAMAISFLAILTTVNTALSSALDSLIITENSSTSLAVTWNGSAITPTLLAGDHWQFNLPVGVELGGSLETAGFPGGAAIPEPGAGTLGPWNNVDTTTTVLNPFVNLVDVTSDSATTSPYNLLFTDNVSAYVGIDASDVSIYLTFHDVGDGTVGNAPDHASTAVLTLISFIGLFSFARWFRACRAN